MANFNRNNWYQVTLKSGDVLSLASSTVGNGAGSAFFQITNTSRPTQQWQLFGSEDGPYVVRSAEGGPTGYLTARPGSSVKTSVNSGNTVPGLSDYTVADKSMYWTIKPWGDGSFWMSNQANGTRWHLERESNGLGAMSSNITAPQLGQSFVFKSLGKINDAKYSTVQTATSTPTATPPPATTSGAGLVTGTAASSQSSSAASQQSSSGLSTGAKAGIGAVGGLALIALVLGILLLMRRGRQKVARSAGMDEPREIIDNTAVGLAGDSAALAGHSDQKEKYAELPETSRPTAELGAEPVKVLPGPPVELDAGPQASQYQKRQNANYP